MMCGNLLETVFDSGKCALVLVAATLYRSILFIIFLSASVGPATLVCYLYIYITGREPYPEVQPAICMMLISCWAEFSIGIEKRFCGNLLDHFKSGFPSVMSFGRFTVHFAMYIFAFCELYLEFEKVHTIPEPHKDRRDFLHRRHNLFEEITSEEEREAIAKANEPSHVTIFLFALAYLVFVTSRNFHKDLLLIMRNLPSVTFSMLNNWLIRIAFAIIHAFVNLFYFLPCLAIAYTANNYKTSGLTTYFQLTFTAGMAGMIAALFELNRPWPQRRGQLPFLFHENNIFGKSLLAHVLVVGILYFFYRPKNHPKIMESKFDSTNHDVICFCLIVAYTTLHIVKFGVHAVLSLAHEYDHRMHEINNAMVDIPEVRGSNSRNGNHSPNGSGSNSVENGGMCARCIANMLNNNSPLPSPAQNHVNQDNENNSPVQPQCESASERSEEGSAFKEERENKAKQEKSMDIENNETVVDETGVEKDQKRNEDSVEVKDNAVTKTCSNIECQLSLSCENSQVDLNVVNEQNNKIHRV